jgi:putative transposase
LFYCGPQGIDFFTVEVLTWGWLATCYVLFFLHLKTRRNTLAGITEHPTEEWMVHMAGTAVDEVDGALLPAGYAFHNRDTEFCSSFRTMLQSSGVKPILLPPRSPKSECVRRALGTLHQARVFIDVDPV